LELRKQLLAEAIGIAKRRHILQIAAATDHVLARNSFDQ
jgi:hypothetical protein